MIFTVHTAHEAGTRKKKCHWDYCIATIFPAQLMLQLHGAFPFMCCMEISSPESALIYYDCISIFRGTPDFQRCDRMIQAWFPKATFQVLMEQAMLESLS